MWLNSVVYVTLNGRCWNCCNFLAKELHYLLWKWFALKPNESWPWNQINVDCSINWNKRMALRDVWHLLKEYWNSVRAYVTNYTFVAMHAKQNDREVSWVMLSIHFTFYDMQSISVLIYHCFILVCMPTF